MTAPNPTKLALVMTGGGARAAYQVGFLRTLQRIRPGLHVPILTGVSAGAINAAFLAARTEPWPERVEQLAELWSTLEAEQVFQLGSWQLLRRVVGWGAGLASGGRLPIKLRSMVDTEPLGELLASRLGASGGDLVGVRTNVERGELEALAITTSSYSTGQSITWVQGRAIETWERPNRRSHLCRMTVDHVMASSSLPLFFPAIRIGDAWYGDGGMRLTAPLAPAVHLGATKILAISTRTSKSFDEAAQPVITGYPPPAQVAGQLLNSIFLDQLDGDALRMDRINRLLARLPEQGDETLRPVDLFVARPSEDLGALANRYEPRLPGGFRFLTRGTGTKRTRSNDLLSLVMFQPDYLRHLLELGERDAEARHGELEAFLED